jgi:hypothetical protein
LNLSIAHFGDAAKRAEADLKASAIENSITEKIELVSMIGARHVDPV